MSNLIMAAPALPLHTAGKYVAGAYLVFVVLLLVYLAIMAFRAQRTERELVELRRDVEAKRAAEREREMEEAVQ
jgi:hypothetical protein